jgi:PAS domain S-box-containing protein
VTDPLLSPIKILIVDDDEVDRMVILRALKRAGIQAEISTAESIAQAVAVVHQHSFDCVFLDYRLPGGDGLELLQTFRNEGFTMPIIVVTSQGDEKIAVEVMKSGGTDYITKQMLNTEGIAQIMRNAIRTHQTETERRATSAALAASEARLYEAQRIANIGSLEIDLQTGTRYWSDQMYRILGYQEPLKELPQVDLFVKHIHPDHVERVEELFRTCVKEGTSFKFDMEVINVTGAPRHVEVHCRAIRDDNGRTIKVVGTMQDISARKETERALIEARDAAERSAKAKEEFLANMSHEIRTPMNAIIGFCKLLNNTPLNAEQREYLQAVDNSGKTLIAIINDILDLSKVASGRLEFERQPFSLPELLGSLIGIFKPKAAEKSLRLGYVIGPSVPNTVSGDATRLNQILLNLVGNAVKFTEVGEVGIEVKVTRETASSCWLLFEVHDSGIGIAQDKLESIFESFTQASNETTRKYGGTGLGLTICKRLVELQGGRIGVESELGRGSTFFIELPFGKVGEKAAEAPDHFTEERPRNLVQQAHILLAEDNQLNQVLARRILEQAGHRVVIAGNGVEALRKVEQAAFDLVLMDIQMPEMDGFSALRAIRAHNDPRIRTLPVIALTAHAFAEEAERCRVAGFSEFMAKPFQPDKLLGLIRKIQLGKTTSPSIEAPINLGGLDALVAGDIAFRDELIGIFIHEAPLALSKLQAAQEAGNGEAMYQAAHGIKPSFMLMGIPEAKELMEQLEEKGRGSGPDATTASTIGLLKERATAAITALGEK